MSEKIEAAKKVIMDLLETLRVHANMVICREKTTDEANKMYEIVVDRANSWLASIEPPVPVSIWEPHQQRVWIEKQELDERAMKLTHFIGGNPLFRKMTYEDQHLLYDQKRLMYQYSEVLGKRIERFFEPPPDDMVDQLSESAGLTLDKLVAVVEASESINRLETIEIAAAQDNQANAEKVKKLGEYWQEPEAVTVSVTMAPGAEPLTADKAKELDKYLDKYLQRQIKQRGAPKLFNVQDSERPAFVIAHSFEEALDKWKVAVAEENATDSEYEEVPPAGIMHVCDGDELIIDQGFADKANS